MFGSSILDVAIGMAFVYLLLSLIASGIQEGIAAIAQTRASNLLQGLQSLFSGDNALLKELYDHGLIRGLYRDPTMDQRKIKAARPLDWLRKALRWTIGMAPAKSANVVPNSILLPAYIPSRTFALALIDILDPAASGSPVTLDRLRTTLAAGLVADPGNKALQAIAALADSAGYDLKVFQASLEDWYNDAMDRISGWYKKHTQNFLLLIGLALAVAFNVNSIRVAETLWTNKDARDAMVDAAKHYMATNKSPDAQQSQKDGATTGKPPGGQDANSANQTSNAQNNPQDRPQGQAEDVKPKPQVKTPNGEDPVWASIETKVGGFQEIENKTLLPLGWKKPLFSSEATRQENLKTFMFALIGWLITALALSLGASFWFDTLNKFMVIRGTIKPDEKSQPEPSKG